MNPFIIESSVFCEGARLEAGGKFILFGVTPPDVRLSTLPAAIPLAIWLSIRPLMVDKFRIFTRALDTDKREILRGTIDGETVSLERTALLIGPVLLTIEKIGGYDFEWSSDETNWEKMTSFNITGVGIPT